jgi:hypothetical protein
MPQQNEEHGPKYHFWVDGVEHIVHESSLTVAEIKQVGGVPPDLPLLLLNDGGTEEVLADEEVIELKPGRRFARAPRFKRG